MLRYTICLRKGKVEEKHSHPARDQLLRLHRFRKFPFSSVLMSAGKRCFQITSFWSAFLKSCIFGNCFIGDVWTKPQWLPVFYQVLCHKMQTNFSCSYANNNFHRKVEGSLSVRGVRHQGVSRGGVRQTTIVSLFYVKFLIFKCFNELKYSIHRMLFRRRLLRLGLLLITFPRADHSLPIIFSFRVDRKSAN